MTEHRRLRAAQHRRQRAGRSAAAVATPTSQHRQQQPAPAAGQAAAPVAGRAAGRAGQPAHPRAATRGFAAPSPPLRAGSQPTVRQGQEGCGGGASGAGASAAGRPGGGGQRRGTAASQGIGRSSGGGRAWQAARPGERASGALVYRMSTGYRRPGILRERVGGWAQGGRRVGEGVKGRWRELVGWRRAAGEGAGRDNNRRNKQQAQLTGRWARSQSTR